MLSTNAHMRLANNCIDGNATDCRKLVDYYQSIVRAGGIQYNSQSQAEKSVSVWATHGCEANDAGLCIIAGSTKEQKLYNLRIDPPQAIENYLKGCELNNGLACTRLGEMMDNSRWKSWTSDYEYKSAELYKKGCDLGNQQACGYLTSLTSIANSEGAEDLKANNIPFNFTTMSDAFIKSCSSSPVNGEACVKLGQAYENGSGGAPVDYKLAKQFYGVACSRIEYAEACYRRGLMSQNLRGLTGTAQQSYYGALDDFKDACKFGIADACLQISQMTFFQNDDYPGVEKDVPTLIEAQYNWCLIDGNKDACEYAADAYFQGKQGVAQDIGKGAAAYGKHCRQNDIPWVCANYGATFTWNTKWAPQSMAMAKSMYNYACDKGNEWACNELQSLTETGFEDFINPMLPDGERFMLAKFDIDAGNAKRGLATMQWLALQGMASAEFELGMLYLYGYGDLIAQDQYKAAELLVSAMNKHHPEASMAMVWQLYNDNNFANQIYKKGFTGAVYHARYIGAPGIVEFDKAENERRRTLSEASHQRMVAQHQANKAAQRNADQQTVDRAWDDYRKWQKDQADGAFCTLVYGKTNVPYKTCVSRSYARRNGWVK